MGIYFSLSKLEHYPHFINNLKKQSSTHYRSISNHLLAVHMQHKPTYLSIFSVILYVKVKTFFVINSPSAYLKIVRNNCAEKVSISFILSLNCILDSVEEFTYNHVENLLVAR